MNWELLEKKFDSKRVIGTLEKFPNQIEEAVKISKRFSPSAGGNASNIVFCGMGGSGIGGKITKNILFNEIKVPIEIVSDYKLPEFVDSSTLVVAVSYSGSTEETVSCFEEAKQKGAKVAAIATAKTLANVPDPKIIIPTAPQPRMALGSLITPLFFILNRHGLIENKEKELLECAEFLEKEKKPLMAEAKKIALKIKGKFPVIYAESGFGTNAYRFRCELNENAKVLAMHSEMPELNHNEVNCEVLPKNSFFVFIRHKEESEKIRKRFEFTKKNFGKYPSIEIWLKGKNKIEKSLYGIFLTDLVSYYLALLNKKDPDKIPVITKLHALMDKN